MRMRSQLAYKSGLAVIFGEKNAFLLEKSILTKDKYML